MRCLKEIQNIVFGLLCKYRIIINNKRYKELYKLYHGGDYEYEVVTWLQYGYDECSFNYREIGENYNNIYKIHGLQMKLTGNKVPNNY